MEFATFLFRTGKNGNIEAAVFDSDDRPGSDWVDSPAKCKHVNDPIVIVVIDKPKASEQQSNHKPNKEPTLDTREGLIAEAERRCIEIDKRWGIGRLREILGLD